MTRTAAVLVLTFLASACARQGEQDEAQYNAIFRWINVGSGGDSIRLGEPFHQAARYATRLNDTSYRLRPRTFGGADSIYVDLAPTGVVKALRFVYDSDVQYGELVDEYARSLAGPATQVRMTRGANSATWVDAETRFVVVAPQGGGSRVRAALLDRQLSSQQPQN